MRAAALALALLAAPARAAGPEVWAALYDARLMQSAERDPSAAIGVYETLLRDLDRDDPLRGEVLYLLGRARLEAGDEDAALEILAEAAAEPGWSAAARRLAARVRLRRSRVDHLPFVQDFGEDVFPWVRGWTRGSDDDLRMVEWGPQGEPVLSWTTEVREGQGDFILLAFSEHLDRPPRRMRFIARAEGFPAHLRLLAEDDVGREWTAPVIEAGTDAWTAVDVAFSSFVPARAPASPERLDPRRVRAVVLRDVSAFHAPDRGRHVVLLDDVEIR